jgi:hypothetical protein
MRSPTSHSALSESENLYFTVAGLSKEESGSVGDLL